jgi:serine/threonine-protein kinase
MSSISQMPTNEDATAESPKAPVSSPTVSRLVSSDSVPAGGFAPGAILADRYRIIGLLGHGGMGEVYRADDLKLGQPVALKFLPQKLADDAVRRERLFAEVRIARQVSHPNICRVYDIGELEGRNFLTMEYIDGEDLASLLKRIGSLHGAKALDVARQICAGLSAAHDKGVLHRDLKPANVMIDGRGRVRITDFGLAVAAEEESEGDVSGTPSFMAPEQFAGKGASVRSDIYALGLVLYELFTGKRAYEAKTLAELQAKKEASLPKAPSEIVRDIDPIVERVILRCVEKDPRHRPASAVELARALPGGDPLAAALAAGETPSPEMVAASGSTEGLRPWLAWACLAFILTGIGLMIAQDRLENILYKVPIEKEPAVLVQTSKDILSAAGYTDPPADSAFKFISNTAYMDHVEKNDQSPNRFEKIPALTIQFWYRQSPLLLFHTGISSGVELSDPPFTNKKESVVWLDARGHLTGLLVIPSEELSQSGPFPPPDWPALFTAAGLDEDDFTSVEPESIPSVFADTRAAWTGTLPDFPETAIRIEAAAWQGKPVSWRMIVPAWDNYSTATLPKVQLPPGTDIKVADIIVTLLAFLLLVVGPAFFARRNLRMGRGDRRGAARLACFIFILLGVAWVFGEHHIAATAELVLLFISAAFWLLVAGWIWLMYIALEPYARRRWPGMLVGWSRLLAGNYRDPLVGREMLIGFVTAASLGFLVFPYTLVSGWLGAPQLRPSIAGLDLFSGSHRVIASVLGMIAESILIGLAIAFVVFLLRIFLRRTWIVATGLIMLVFLLAIGSSVVQAVLASLFVGIVFFVFIRFGLLALIMFVLLVNIGDTFPITTQMSAWYLGIGITGLVLQFALILYAFHTSLGGQPLFGRLSLED